MNSSIVYEASVYERTVKYTNFKGVTQEKTLFFALDPLKLLQVIAEFRPRTNKRSGNPARQGQIEEITNDEQIKFVRDLASRAAGFPSDDGEAFEPYERFDQDLAGQAFLTKLISSDDDRKEFVEKVILAPFAAFVSYAEADPGNSPKEVQQFKVMLGQLENIFKESADNDETLEERKARLEAELKAMDAAG